MNLVRKILLAVQAKKDTQPGPIEGVDEPDSEKLFRHIEMLHAAGLLELYGGGVHRAAAAGRADMVLVKDLSWEDHEFLANLEQKGVWKTMQAKFLRKWVRYRSTS
jgi:hypothetical protein